MLVSTVVAVGLAAHLALTPSAAPERRPLPAEPSDFGAGAVECVLRLTRAYSNRDLPAYARMLPLDFHFTFGDAELRAAQPDGFTRNDEIASADHLFHGFIDREGRDLPRARSITIQLDSLYVVPDPAHDDSAEVYQCVVVSRTSLEIEFATGDVVRIGPDVHQYHCVRRDVARLGQDQLANPDAWYVRTWEELPAIAAPLPRPAASFTTRIPAMTSPAALAIRPLANPIRGPGAVQLTLPAAIPVALDVLDVVGRRVDHRTFDGLAAGVHRLPFTTGGLAPGVYWLRVTQGRASSASRVVLIH